MTERSFDMFLKVLFGAGGVTILVFTWTQTMPASERIIATSVGLIGILWAIIRVPLLGYNPANK